MKTRETKLIDGTPIIVYTVSGKQVAKKDRGEKMIFNLDVVLGEEHWHLYRKLQGFYGSRPIDTTEIFVAGLEAEIKREQKKQKGG